MSAPRRETCDSTLRRLRARALTVMLAAIAFAWSAPLAMSRQTPLPAPVPKIEFFDLPVLKENGGYTVADFLKLPPFSDSATNYIELWCTWTGVDGKILRKSAAAFSPEERLKLIVLRYTPGFGSRQGYIPDLQSPPDPKSDRRKYHDLAASMTDKGGVVGVEIEPPVEEHAVSALPIAVGVLIGAFVVGGVAIALFRARLRTRGGGPA